MSFFADVYCYFSYSSFINSLGILGVILACGVVMILLITYRL